MLHNVFIDQLIGPSHHFGGLAKGNPHSENNQYQTSNPQQAALQALQKMNQVAQLGIPQYVFPPHLKNHEALLNVLGYCSDNPYQEAYDSNPAHLSAVFSSASAWCANWATFTSSQDSFHQKAQISIANLSTNLHRKLESPETYRMLKHFFNTPTHFQVHEALDTDIGDEGAANFIRLWHQNKALSLFIYGRTQSHNPCVHYPARQYKEASESIIKKHGYKPESSLLIPQNPAAIDAGVFHNDVIAMGCKNLLIVHEKAFATAETFEHIQSAYQKQCKNTLNLIVIKEDLLPLSTAVESYLFNAQLIADSQGFSCIFPSSCKNDSQCQQSIAYILAHTREKLTIKYSDLSESLSNGGGPACLRLQCFLTYEELQHLPEPLRLSEEKASVLQLLIQNDYPSHLNLEDFCHIKTVRTLNKIQKRLHELLPTSHA